MVATRRKSYGRKRSTKSRRKSSRRRVSKPRNKFNRGLRPSPAASATLFSVGHMMKGQDGRQYVVKRASNGVKRWQARK